METILKVMLEDHNKIEKLLKDFERCTKLDKQTLKKAFNIFRWELEKHLFIEEKAIFIFYEPDDQEDGYEMIPKLILDHDKIYNKLKQMKKEIKKNKTCDFSDFKELIIDHKDFEDNSFYPNLDQELDETIKEMIIRRVEEIDLDENSISRIKSKCNECGKKIGITNSYYYPKLKNRWLICSNCFNNLEKERLMKKKKHEGLGKWKCTECNYIYDPKKGDPDSGIPPGTAFEDIPDNWICPVCGVGTNKFEKL